ncbi:hypothetical protein E3P99_01359 [Wallemia hederae]|uniref:Uncharacterized protein n=1 Tax=Wallemia hederae TaxID=1540922 RepID=A0A4T0FS24_9BASI|nr:hypothetical protein E3P99_01359 [Wallemia hederae]
MLATDNDDERTLKLQRQLNSKDDEIRSYENKLFMANNDYHDLENNYKDANYRAARESERANKLENMSVKHNDEIKKLKLQLANYETTLESTESRLRGLKSSESFLEKRLTSSQSNQDAIRTLESKLDAVNSNLKDMTTEKTRLSEKLIELENQLMASESHNKKLREEIDDNVMAMSSQQNTSFNRRDSVSIKELLNSQIETQKEKLSKTQQELNMVQNQLMALTRSSKREIEQLQEQAQEGQEAQQNLQSVLAQSDAIQSELDRKTLALESAQSEVRQLQLQVIEEQSKSTQRTATQSRDEEMSISELEDAIATPASRSALNMSSNSKLLGEISRLMAMIQRLRADRDGNLGRAHFAETELKFSQDLHQKDLLKHEKELGDLTQSRNDLIEELKSTKITTHEYEQQVKKLSIDLEKVRHDSTESAQALERSLSQAKLLLTDMEQTETQHLIKIDAAAAQYKALQDSYAGHRDKIIELETALGASQEEAREAKEDLQDWEEHHLTLQEGAVGIIERLQERLDESRDKLRSVEVNYGIAQDRIQSMTTDFDNDRAAYEARIDDISSKFDAALESEHERATFMDSRLTQLTDMSNTLRENFAQTRLNHSEEIKNLRNEHAIELSNMKQSHESSIEDRTRQVDAAIQLHEDHHASTINNLQADIRKLSSEKEELAGYLAQKENDILDLKAQYASDIEQLNLQKQQEFDEACKKFDEKLVELERRSVDAEGLGEVMIDDAQHKAEYHNMEIQYEQRIRELLDEKNSASEKIRDLESKLNESLENVINIQNASGTNEAGDSTLGNSTLKNFFEQSAASTGEQSLGAGHDTLNNLFQGGQPSYSGGVVDLSSSSEGEATPNQTLQSGSNTINNTLFATDLGVGAETMDQSMINESVRDSLADSVIGSEVLDQTDHGLEIHNNHPDRSVTDASNIPLLTEQHTRIVELEQQLIDTTTQYRADTQRYEQQIHDAEVKFDEKLAEALSQSEERIRVLYEEFKKAELENKSDNPNNSAASSEQYQQLLKSIETDYVSNETHESKLQAMSEIISDLKLKLEDTTRSSADLEERLSRQGREFAERKGELEKNVAAASETITELEATHSEATASLEQKLASLTADYTSLSHEYLADKDQILAEMHTEKQSKADIETELEVLRQDRINDNLKLEEVTTLLEKITHEYEHKQHELSRLIDTHDGEVDHQKQLVATSNERVSELSSVVEELESKLKSAEESHGDVDSEMYNELKNDYKELDREFKALQEERDQYAQQLDSSTKLIEEGRTEYDALLEKAKEESKMMTEEIDSVKAKLNNEKQLRNQLQETYKSIETESENRRIKVEELLTKVETDQALLLEADDSRKRYNDTKEQLEAVNSQLTKNGKLVEEREAEIATLNDALSTQSAAVEDVARLEEELKKLTQQRDDATEAVKDSNHQAQEYKDTISGMEGELNVASSALAKLEAEKEELLSKAQSSNSGQSSADAEELEDARERIQHLESSLESAQQMTEEAEDRCLELEKSVKRLNGHVDRLKAAIKEHPKAGAKSSSSKKDDEPKASTSSTTPAPAKTKVAAQSVTQKKAVEVTRASASPRANVKKRLRDQEDEGEEQQPRKNPNPSHSSHSESSPVTRSRKKSERLSGTPQKRQPSLLSKNKAFTPRRHASQPHSQSNQQSGSGSGTSDNREGNSRRSSQRQQNSQASQISDLRGRLNQFKKQ